MGSVEDCLIQIVPIELEYPLHIDLSLGKIGDTSGTPNGTWTCIVARDGLSNVAIELVCQDP